MQKSDIKALFNQNWRLAIRLSLMNSETLAHVTVINPNTLDVDSRYAAFCDKLSIQKRPWLIIVDDTHADKIWGMKEAEGSYYPLGDFIHLRKSIYEGLASAMPESNYTVAHEVGHAKDLHRRRWLQYVTIGVGAEVARRVVGRATQKVAETGMEKENAELVGATANLITGPPAILMLWCAFVRRDEFAADDYAAFIIGHEECLKALPLSSSDAGTGKKIEGFKNEYFKKYLQKMLDPMEQDFRAKHIHMTPEQLGLACTVFVLNSMMEERTVSLSRIIKDGAYPDNFERARRLVQQQTAPHK